ncbi:MAG: efflux RND transporter periplasmic adaptor subunit [Bacillota bacterium]
MKKKTAAVIGGIVVLAASFWLIFKPHSAKNLNREYDFYSVKRMDLSERIDATGNVLALEKKDLYADYDGTVERVNVKAGDKVKKGDILLSITSATLKEQWQEANSNLKQAQVNLSQAAAQLATEIAINRVSTTNAMQLENQYHQVALYKEQVNQVQKKLDALNAKNDGYYVANNEQLFIRAPFDGEVAWVDVNQGDRISPQMVLATVMKPDALGVEAMIDQNDINLVKIGQKALVTGKDKEQSQNPGQVTEISSMGQAEQTITGQTTTSTILATDGVIDFPVRIKLAADSKGLKPGMSVDVTVLANERPNALAVPAGSVVEKNGRATVKVRRNNRLVPVDIGLGLNHGKFWEVTSGLKAGDQVAVAKPLATAQQPVVFGGGRRTGMPGFGR